MLACLSHSTKKPLGDHVGDNHSYPSPGSVISLSVQTKCQGSGARHLPFLTPPGPFLHTDLSGLRSVAQPLTVTSQLTPGHFPHH